MTPPDANTQRLIRERDRYFFLLVEFERLYHQWKVDDGGGYDDLFTLCEECLGEFDKAKREDDGGDDAA